MSEAGGLLGMERDEVRESRRRGKYEQGTMTLHI